MSTPTAHVFLNAASTPVLEAKRVVKRFGDNVVLRGLNLAVN